MILALYGCPSTDRAVGPLTASVPLHLEEHLEVADVVATLPDDAPAAMEWRFDRPEPDWRVLDPRDPSVSAPRTERVDDALRIHLSEANSTSTPDGRRRRMRGSVYADLPDWEREDWAHVLVRARTGGGIGSIGLNFNLRDPADAESRGEFAFGGEYVDLFQDGAVHTYLLRADWSYGEWSGPWRQLGLTFSAREPGSIDLLSVSVIPKEARFAEAAVGVATVARGDAYRRVLYAHTPGRVAYRLTVPEGGRLDTALGVLRDDVPVTFRVTVEAADGSEGRTLLEQDYADAESWSAQSVELSEWAGQTVTLGLETESGRDGTVALWASPVVSGDRAAELPNVVLYVIDAASAEYMSVYGYNRRTTPNLERLATRGAVFEHAYSNSTWSKTSTPSFMTGLQHSVLGGYVNESDRVPDDVVTLPEHLRAAGYQTAVITSNPYAGTISGLEQGVDYLRESGVEPNSTSSRQLHADFWEWRETFPGEPYFVHFQTTDVHWPYRPPPPFAGTFVDADRRERFYERERRLAEAAGMAGPSWLSANRYPPETFDEAGVDRQTFFEVGSALYDEAMAHNDRQIGRLVERLQALGEWDNTLFIVASDHGNDHALGAFDPLPPRWKPMFQPFVTRVPLIVVWPDRVRAGARFTEPVSMIDLVPTILDLAGLPAPEVTQGQSLAPLLRGNEDAELAPVILEEAYFDAHTHELSSVAIEIVDGRWAASLGIEPEPEGESDQERQDGKGGESGDGDEPGHGEPGDALEPAGDGDTDGDDAPPDRRPSDLLLYDLWSDPYCLRSLHDERPELAERYREILRRRWNEHQELARRFGRSETGALTPEQLRALRSLGYIQ